MTDPIRYAYVIASSFSGSTLLAMLLDTHPRAASISELENSILGGIKQGEISEYVCSCGAPIRQCEFFRRVQARCAEDGVELDLHDFPTRLAGRLGGVARLLLFGAPGSHFWLQNARDTILRAVPAYRRHVEGVFNRSEVIARAVLDVSGKDVFVDASKSVARAFHLLERSGLDLRLIHLVRDLRAVAYSRIRRGRPGLAGGVRYWRRTHAAALELKKRIPPDRYFMLRWEDFCRHPQEGLDQLCLFIGVEPAELVSIVNERPHHVIGNAMRLKPIESIRSQEAWREALTREQLAVCDRIGGDLNRSLGYA